MIENKLERSKTFDRKIKGFGREERKAIFTHFVTTFENCGFQGLNSYKIDEYLVRNKDSSDVDKNDNDFVNKVKLAQKYNLWHFHVGFYDYGYDVKGYQISSKGDLTSQWVVHYQHLSDNHIKAVNITPHPPFELPSEQDLE